VRSYPAPFVLPSLAGAALLLLLGISSASSLWDRDEARFATAAREMSASGNLLTPTFNGELRAQKPVLATWLMAASVRLLGPTAVAVRLWSVLALVAAALVAASLGGRPAFLVVLATPLALVEGTAATTDALLVAFLTGALAVHASTLEKGYRTRHVVALGLLLGLAQLTKGPVGLALPLLAIASARRLAPSGPAVRRPVLLSTLLSLALFAAWALPANAATGGRYLAFGLGREVLTRIATPLEGHGGSYLLSLPYYLPVLVLGFSPFTLYLPAALALLWTERRDPRAALLLAWIAAPFAVFTLVATKLPHYVLPAWPALAVAVSGAVERAGRGEAPPVWLARGRWLFASTQALLLSGLVAGALLTPFPGPLALLAVALVAASATALRLSRRGRHSRAAVTLGATSFAGMAAAALWLLPRLEVYKPVPRLASRIPAAVPVATLGFAEPSLDFYVGRPPIAHLGSEPEARRWLEAPGPGVLVLPRAALARLASGARAPREIASERGYNLSKGEWVELVAVERIP